MSHNSKRFVFSATKKTSHLFTSNLIYGELEAHAKYQNPRATISWRKVAWGEERKRKSGGNTVNTGHYVLSATPKGSAHTSLGPTILRKG